jgi:transcriptional regulator with XRE-family HTH domain
VVTFNGPDSNKALRVEWGRNLAEHLAMKGWNRKQLQTELTSIGYPVTHQAISSWISGKTSPRPVMQAAVAKVLGVPHRSIFTAPTVAA